MQRFVLKPRFNNLAEYQLHHKDILTYVTIRSYYNTKDKYAYPSYATIQALSGLSKKFVGESVKRLETAGFMDIWKVGKFHVKHFYKFDETKECQRIPYGLLSDPDLNSTEKSILLMIADTGRSYHDFEEILNEICQNSGLVKKTVKQHFRTLSLKGYLAIELVENILDNTLIEYLKLTDKLKWSTGYNSYAPKSTATLKANDVESESWAMSVIDMVTSMIRNSAKSTQNKT